MWLKGSWLWLLRTRVLPHCPGDGRPSALDVGCGPGFVMEELRDLLRPSGVDLDADMVSACTARGLDVVEASAYELCIEHSPTRAGTVTAAPSPNRAATPNRPA